MPGQRDRPQLLVEGPRAEELARRDWPRSDLHSFEDFEVQDMVATALDEEVPLKHGFAFVEPTRAFVAIDVNTAGEMNSGAGLRANISLAKELPRILRCRGLGGQVVVDFAPMPKKFRGQVEAALQTALKADDVKTDLVGWTGLGHFEVRRAFSRFPVHWT